MLYPLGVTPQNILHTSGRRNEALARVFHDLKLMEREGSGFDLVYDRLLSSGRAAPTASEGIDSVHVVVPRRVIQVGAIRLVAKAQERFALSQRERITLALLAQTEALSAPALAQKLELQDAEALRPWLGRLVEWKLVEQTGRTKATRYHVPPALLRDAGLDHLTTLTRVEPPRLKGLILEDLDRHPLSASSDIHRRIGAEIPARTFRRTLESLASEGLVTATGVKRWRRYRVANPNGQGVAGLGRDEGRGGRRRRGGGRTRPLTLQCRSRGAITTSPCASPS